MSKFTGEWPKGLNTQGLLSFPITSDADIEALQEYRLKKQIKKPKYADKIGVSLLLTQTQVDKISKHLEETYLPFVNVLYKETDGEKGVEPDEVKTLLALVKKRDWTTKQLPLRDLTPKDVENRPDEKYVAKIKVQGPYESAFSKKAIVMNGDGSSRVATIDELIDEDVIPEGKRDINQLWWGAGWTFRTNLRFNAFSTANLGVTAYGQTLYLLPHLGLPVSSGGDAAVLDEGDDWSDEE